MSFMGHRIKEINGHYVAKFRQIDPKPELSLFSIPTNRAHPGSRQPKTWFSKKKPELEKKSEFKKNP